MFPCLAVILCPMKTRAESEAQKCFGSVSKDTVFGPVGARDLALVSDALENLGRVDVRRHHRFRCDSGAKARQNSLVSRKRSHRHRQTTESENVEQVGSWTAGASQCFSQRSN